MVLSNFSMADFKQNVRAGACAIVIAGVAAGCASSSSSSTSSSIRPIRDIPDLDSTSARDLCAKTGYDPDVVVFRDKSSRLRLAAIGVTGSGNLKDFAAVVGPSVITTRGGATVTGSTDVDVETRACDTYK